MAAPEGMYRRDKMVEKYLSQSTVASAAPSPHPRRFGLNRASAGFTSATAPLNSGSSLTAASGTQWTKSCQTPSGGHKRGRVSATPSDPSTPGSASTGPGLLKSRVSTVDQMNPPSVASWVTPSALSAVADGLYYAAGSKQGRGRPKSLATTDWYDSADEGEFEKDEDTAYEAIARRLPFAGHSQGGSQPTKAASKTARGKRTDRRQDPSQPMMRTAKKPKGISRAGFESRFASSRTNTQARAKAQTKRKAASAAKQQAREQEQASQHQQRAMQAMAAAVAMMAARRHRSAQAGTPAAAVTASTKPVSVVVDLTVDSGSEDSSAGRVTQSAAPTPARVRQRITCLQDLIGAGNGGDDMSDNEPPPSPPRVNTRRRQSMVTNLDVDHESAQKQRQRQQWHGNFDLARMLSGDSSDSDSS